MIANRFNKSKAHALVVDAARGLSMLMLAAGLGCAPAEVADSAAGQQVDKEIRITPTDTEQMARLTVVLPTGTCTVGSSCLKPLSRNPVLTLDGAAISLGAEQRILPGTHTVRADGNAYSVTLAAAEQKSLTLAVANRKCTADPLPNVSPTDFGATPTVANVACPTKLTNPSWTGSSDPFANGGTMSWFYNGSPGSCATTWFAGWTKAQINATTCSSWGSSTISGFTIPSAGNTCFPLNVSASVLCAEVQANNFSRFQVSGPNTLTDGSQAYVPGGYQYVLGQATTPVDVTLAEGAIVEIGIQLPVTNTLPSLFTTALTFAEARELPDAAKATITSSIGGERTYALASGNLSGLNLKAYVNPNAVYTLNVNGRTKVLDQTKANAITLKRIDVDSITITREDGSTYVAPGTYELYFGGTRVAGPFATNSGIDVLPGAYELILTYTTAEGTKTQSIPVSL